ncbi:hypothetical protein LOTGIDRAFT_164611 [Lottia gigantea]|uniref:Phospholipase A2-like domain-containing protein n=1 Tax=Lottia gigantea TaxID=225164 RepID=V4A9F8_LOTGI|nr:hypothetical protein LOTGIDRAFT_164611 [Lottia gigantea]ESO89916.1 hypothetical protein LOTGIDRAFT_164611 [Lottia gigantea]
MAFDSNGLYASAMSDLECEYPRSEFCRPFLPEEEKTIERLFNEQKFRPKTAILKVWFEYLTNMFFQPIPAKDKISFTNKEGKKETGTKIGFRNGFCYDVLTSVDIQEIVKSGGRIIRILDGDIQKSLGSLPGFPWAKYPGEKHLPGHNYTGPGTRLDLRLDENDKPKPGEERVNRVDAAALKHDILYRNKDINFRHEADRQMIIELENIPNPTFKERMQRALIIKLLKAKMK